MSVLISSELSMMLVPLWRAVWVSQEVIPCFHYFCSSGSCLWSDESSDCLLSYYQRRVTAETTNSSCSTRNWETADLTTLYLSLVLMKQSLLNCYFYLYYHICMPCIHLHSIHSHHWVSINYAYLYVVVCWLVPVSHTLSTTTSPLAVTSITGCTVSSQIKLHTYFE